MANERTYNDPIGGTPSEIGPQIRQDHYLKQALIEARRLQYFMPLADVTAMPKNMGKKLRKYHYLPLLHDENVNDQGLDAAGAAIADGNLYGSSKDIGTITGKLPALSETGGRVHRVGYTRKEVQGTIEKFGFFDEYTQESLDFDSDAELMQHINREMLNGATEITEDALQIDLINSAGVVRFGGAATSNATVDSTSVVDYGDLLRLSITLDDNRTPKQSKVITGTRMVDTRTIAGGRVLYCGSELQPTLEAMTDLHGNQAFIGVHHYAAGSTILNGEIGSIGYFRIVIVPEMTRWAGGGAASDANMSDYYNDGTNYDVLPMLVVGDGSFSTIGFQTDGKTVKFKIMNKRPGDETADRTDPYGELGFMSIKWYYGFLLLRPERIALVKTAAAL